MLIVEGSDLVGKTTFVKLLLEQAEKEGYPMVPQHFGLIPKGWAYYEDYLPYVHARTVMDRFVLSEIVYGSVIRGGSGIDVETYRLLDAHLRLNGSFTVVLYGDPSWYSRHLNEVYDADCESFSRPHLENVNLAFAELVRAVKWNEYQPDVDAMWDVSHGWPADTDAAVVMQRYLERLKNAKIR